MKTWEFDVVMKVQKTLTFAGPDTEAAAREMMKNLLVSGIDLSTFQKWANDDGQFPKARPVERMLDNDPCMIAMRDVTKDDE